MLKRKSIMLKTENLIMLAALGAAAFMLTRKVGATTLGAKNAAPVIWAQNPTAANNSNTNGVNAALVNAGASWLTKLFAGQATSYPTWTPDYSFSTSMIGTTAPGADLYAINSPSSYYGLGIDTSQSAVGSGWWN